MDKKPLQDCVRFFNSVTVSVNDITTDDQRAEAEKVVEVTYQYQGSFFKTKPLYYREITGLNDVRDIQKTRSYFGGDVYLLDLVTHDWPQPSGKSDLDHLVIDDIAQDGDEECKVFLKLLANNKQDGYIQIITKEGRPGQYYHNLENNNHWHDLVLLIKEVIRKRGQIIDKQFFRSLIYNWDKGKRASFGFNRWNGNYKMMADLYENIKSIQMDEYTLEIKNVLNYKKQIILQGPPGTGKTKLAKQLAKELVGQQIVKVKPSVISDKDIISIIKPGVHIPTVAGYESYTIKRIANDRISSSKSNGTEDSTPFTTIKEFYNQKSWNGEIISNTKRRAAGIAKYIYEKIELVSVKANLDNSDQFKLIQFHPSYSYEDFVRGIVVKPNPDGDGLLYDAEDKPLGNFAKLAYENYQISKEGDEKLTQLLQAKTTLQKFVDHVQDELDKTPDRKYQISDLVYLFDLDDKRFKYKGDNWKAHEKGLNMKFSELEKIIQSGVTQRSDIKAQSNLESLTKQHATYFFNTLEKYREFEKTDSTRFNPIEIEHKIREKNYVLIIDEINRANLSSVLGELIYALEYRGEKVESMYAVDGDAQLILPPNLYIIGTMNTADRSVGHIDYAVRRRFAFVDVLPRDLSPELGDKFHKALFDQVANLFGTYLSPEFEIKDVQLGHSYFIDKTEDGGSMAIRLEYEIKPILIEYFKDGILIGDDILQKIKDLSA